MFNGLSQFILISPSQKGDKLGHWSHMLRHTIPSMIIYDFVVLVECRQLLREETPKR